MRKRDAYLQHLAQVPMFSKCSDAELKTIAQCGTDLVFQPGKDVVHEGRPGHEFFVIVSGQVVVTRGGQEVARLGPGDFFGELALLGEPLRDASITAVTEVETVHVSNQQFRTLLEGAPNLAYALLSGMARRLQQLDRRVAV